MYRGRVTEVSDEGISVEFVDYGNRELVEGEEVFSLPDQFHGQQPFAQVNKQVGKSQY